MEKAKKRARPPPDDPAQSERFVKAASELMGQEGGALYERAMQSIAKPAPLPTKAVRPIIEPITAGKKAVATRTRKSGSAD